MGLRFRRSVKLMPGVKVNFSLRGTSLSLGGRGGHYTISSTGRRTSSFGIPGTGLSYVTTTTAGKNYSKPLPVTYSGAKSIPPAPRKKLAVLILCIVLGLCGAHRFYTGKIGTGVLWLITLGCFGFGWVVDIVMIATNAYTDAWGREIIS